MAEKKTVKKTVKKTKKLTAKKTGKKNLTRVQFSRDSTAKQIFKAIRESQTDWAKKFPERAHRLYPEVFDEQGNRIPHENKTPKK
ncbi:MAG TPA: hypothetical protein PKK96_10855 [Anaerolineales bacterium]|nr:hypothetical protein [Anaerolineales bacterium]HMS00159.1 hypothetical protein [Anaerolineales bacterium]HNQ94129.1 hypothetical protein [Anaerolineales bacterium]HNS61492.1 hypothetical protein [Anaerolineales bacterium]